ncbi:WD40/YVTN/BNR-like repeat-containing protein [Planctomycetota bacterium]
MKSSPIGINNVVKVVLLSVIILAITCGHHQLLAQDQEILLFEENFDDVRVQDWELEDGWTVTEGMLRGVGHSWASPLVGPWRDFRLQFRLKLQHGRIHLIYRLNDKGRYFIGFHEHGSYLNKQYWPDTFIDLLVQEVITRDLDRWHEIEIVGSGPNLQFLVDDELEWEYTDLDPLNGGTFAFETLEDSAAYIDDIRVFGPAPDTSEAWVRTGGPLGGLGYDVRMRPDNPDIMYVTDAWAGVFISTDAGKTWQPSNEGITTRTGESGDAIPVFCLTIDPHDHDTIWIGTQNVRGIFKSTDAGQTWVDKDNGIVEYEGITFRGFTVDPRSSDIVYAAAEISSYAWSNQPQQGREFDKTKGVVYKTIDGGENWTAVWRGDNLARYIWIDPGNSDVLYISTGIFDREAANSDHTANKPGGEGVIKSTDGGQTWQQVNNGLRNLYVGTLFMHPENPDILLAGTGNNAYPDGGGIYITTNGGTSWQAVVSNENYNAIEFALSNPNIAYAGSASAVYRSSDCGQSWRKVSSGEEGWGSPGVRAGFPIDFQVDPRDSNRVFANNYGGGNFLSVDGGQTWTVASDGYTGAQVRAIAVDPTEPSTVYAAARSGFFASTDGGDSWIGRNTPPAFHLEWNAVAVDPSNPQHLVASNNWDPIILQSDNRGQTWNWSGDRLAEGMGWRVITFAPSDPKTLYAGSSAFFSAGVFDNSLPAAGVYVSRDGGATWNSANDTLSAKANIIDICVDPSNPQIVYAATGTNGLLKSADAGGSWTAMNLAIPVTTAALSVTVHPVNSKIIYTGLAHSGLYRSDDGGTTWQPSMKGMPPESHITDILFDPRDPQVLYAADSFSGVYQSTDGGRVWRQINTNLGMRAINRLAVSTDGLHLYAATEGGGVYRLDFNGGPPQPAEN